MFVTAKFTYTFCRPVIAVWRYATQLIIMRHEVLSKFACVRKWSQKPRFNANSSHTKD